MFNMLHYLATQNPSKDFLNELQQLGVELHAMVVPCSRKCYRPLMFDQLLAGDDRCEACRVIAAAADADADAAADARLEAAEALLLHYSETKEPEEPMDSVICLGCGKEDVDPTEAFQELVPGLRPGDRGELHWFCRRCAPE